MSEARDRGVLVQLVFWCPTSELGTVVEWLRRLDAAQQLEHVQMDSHPPEEVLAQLPERIRILNAQRGRDMIETLESLGRE